MTFVISIVVFEEKIAGLTISNLLTYFNLHPFPAVYGSAVTGAREHNTIKILL